MEKLDPFWTALVGLGTFGLLLLGILTAPTNDVLLKTLAISIALIGAVFLYIKLVIEKKIDELESKFKTLRRKK